MDATAGDAFYDVINQPILTTPIELNEHLKTNEAYNMVMTCSTNPCYGEVMVSSTGGE